MTTKRLLISGKVQGVYYRRWTEAAARSLGLSGWVRNIRNGDVEIQVSGPDEKIDELIRRCWDGPPAAEVTAVAVETIEAEPVQGFSARSTQ